MSEIDKITNTDLNGRGVIGLPDTPGLTTTEMQNKLDEIAKDVLVPKVNELVENANATNTTLGTTDISGIGNGTVTGAIDTINSNLSLTELELIGKITTAGSDNGVTIDTTKQYKYFLIILRPDSDAYAISTYVRSDVVEIVGVHPINLNNYGYAGLSSPNNYMSASLAITPTSVYAYTGCLNKGSKIPNITVEVYGLK